MEQTNKIQILPVAASDIPPLRGGGKGAEPPQASQIREEKKVNGSINRKKMKPHPERGGGFRGRGFAPVPESQIQWTQTALIFP